MSTSIARRRIAVALLLGFTACTTAASADASSSAAELQPQTLVRAKVIRTEVNARYRRLSGRKLTVSEVTSTAVVESLTLIADPLQSPRVVPAGNGVYFALCSVRATCPLPARSAAWAPYAFRPRRQALELAVRAFSETSVSLVVVALPTWSPTWIVFERDALSSEVGAPLRDQLAAHPGFADAGLRAAVDRLTLGRTFVPLGIEEVAPGRETIVAVTLFERSRG